MHQGTYAFAYMKTKGSSQGTFSNDGSRAGKEKTLCLSARFRGEVPHDVRGGAYAVTRHEPLAVVHEWGPATVQFLGALWGNEKLEQVELEFVRPDGAGKEEIYATITLSQATVAYVELRSGDAATLAEREQRALSEVGLRFEKLDVTLHAGSGKLTASYDRTKQS